MTFFDLQRVHFLNCKKLLWILCVSLLPYLSMAREVRLAHFDRYAAFVSCSEENCVCRQEAQQWNDETPVHRSVRSVPCRSLTDTVHYATYISHTLGYSRVDRHNSYLSPLLYSGAAYSYRCRAEFPIFCHYPQWYMSHFLEGAFGSQISAARTARMSVYSGQYAVACHYLYAFPFRIVGGIGPRLSLEGVGLNHSRNQNNPFDVECNLDLQFSALLAYEFRYRSWVGRLKGYAHCSLAGIGFCPDYRESYLQAALLRPFWQSLGGHTPLSRMQFATGIQADFPIARLFTLQLAYEWSTAHRYRNNLSKQNASHYFGIGLSTHIRHYSGYKAVQNSQCLNPLYPL